MKTKDELIALVKQNHNEQEDFYCHNGPSKHEQEEHYQDGVSVVRMNVELLESWLDEDEATLESFRALPATERREVWTASGFHFGIMGYDNDDADFWWAKYRI